MSVKVRINGREFTLSWDEFEKAFFNRTSCFEIIDIFTAAGRSMR